MKKTCLLVFMTTILCLTACGTDRKDEALENSSSILETETTTNIENNSDEMSSEMETAGSGENEQESLPKTEITFELTEQGKNFLTQMCIKLNDFNSQTTKDETLDRKSVV